MVHVMFVIFVCVSYLDEHFCIVRFLGQGVHSNYWHFSDHHV